MQDEKNVLQEGELEAVTGGGFTDPYGGRHHHRDSRYIYHVVGPRDTLSGLAAQYHTTVEAIARLNGIKNPDLIIDGSTLRIPNGNYYDPYL